MSSELERALSYLSSSEKETLNTIEKVIIWGYPLHTHTQSYLHACWAKIFKALGKETFWFHDKEFEDPSKFSYKNCLFIAEGFQDEKIPLEPSSIYFVNFCIYPQKYLRSGARLFEIRFKLEEFHDCNNDWNLKDGSHTLTNLSEDVLYESLQTNIGVAPEFRGPVAAPMNYEAVYMQWPTDLLPWEINLEDAEKEHEPVVHYVGTPYGNPRLEKFKEVLKKKNIEFIQHNPWVKPISFEEGRDFIQKSILAPDFRPEGSDEDRQKYGEKNGKNHLAIGYIPCRLFKNISYGHLPLTDSPHAVELFGEAVVFEKDIESLVEKGLEAQKDIERKKRAMRMIAERHTYLQRARDLLRAIAMPRPGIQNQLPSTWNQVTLVTSLIDIRRDNIDGRKFEDYMKWFEATLKIPAPMVCFVEPSIVGLVSSIRESLPTQIISQSFGETPLAWSTPFLHETQQSEEWKRCAKNPKDINNLSAPYVTLMHSKFAWVWNTLEKNPFNTDMFFWIDAGLSRFWEGFHPLSAEPHPRFLRRLRNDRKIYCQVGGYKEELLKRGLFGPKFTTNELIGNNENVIMGGFWGGPIAQVRHLCEFGMRFFTGELIKKHRVDNDQPTIFFHVQENPQMYAFVPPFPKINYANFLIMAMGKIME
jgi:hypothetical protein